MIANVRTVRVAILFAGCVSFGAIHCSSDGSSEEPTTPPPNESFDAGETDAARADEPDAEADATNDADAQASAKAVPYTNPVYDADFPDPAVLRGTGGVFHAFATGGLIQHATSSDLVHWTKVADALIEKPSWANQKDAFWAPDIFAADGTYYLYFAAEQNAGNGSHCVGVATASTLAGPFVDVGQPLVCSSDYEAIDPHAYDDPSGKRLLYWGSASKPIHVRELGPDRTAFAANTVASDVLPTSARPYENLVEGPWLRARDGFEYLFYSGDNCCGDSAHYAVMVARANSALGPFAGPVTTGASDNTILVANEKWNAPGHNAIVTDDVGDDWIVYHAFDRADPSKRKLLLDKITYANGWPAIAGRSPSTTMQTGPMLVVP